MLSQGLITIRNYDNLSQVKQLEIKRVKPFEKQTNTQRPEHTHIHRPTHTHTKNRTHPPKHHKLIARDVGFSSRSELLLLTVASGFRVRWKIGRAASFPDHSSLGMQDFEGNTMF